MHLFRISCLFWCVCVCVCVCRLFKLKGKANNGIAKSIIWSKWLKHKRRYNSTKIHTQRIVHTQKENKILSKNITKKRPHMFFNRKLSHRRNVNRLKREIGSFNKIYFHPNFTFKTIYLQYISSHLLTNHVFAQFSDRFSFYLHVYSIQWSLI